MSSENECVDRADVAPPMPGTETIRAWGLATLLLITLALTSHELTQARQQLEDPESQPSSTQTARDEAQPSRLDMARIIQALKDADSASRMTAAKLRRELGGVNTRIEAALEETDKLAAASNDVAGLRRELKAAQNKLEKAIVEIEAHKKRVQQD